MFDNNFRPKTFVLLEHEIRQIKPGDIIFAKERDKYVAEIHLVTETGFICLFSTQHYRVMKNIPVTEEFLPIFNTYLSWNKNYDLYKIG